jgi:hypothetical protein
MSAISARWIATIPPMLKPIQIAAQCPNKGGRHLLMTKADGMACLPLSYCHESSARRWSVMLISAMPDDCA